MKKVLVSTPAQGGLVSGGYAISMAETYALLLGSGVTCMLSIRTCSSLLMSDRNQILADFLKTDFTHLLCVDADISWKPQAVLELLSYEQDFVGVCYVARGTKSFCFRPELDANGLMVETEQGLIEMQTIPAGFMLLSRNLIQTLCDKNSQLYYKPKWPQANAEMNLQTGDEGFALFTCEIIDGEFWGEDYVFCLRARQAGFKVLVDPKIELDHAGLKCSLKTVMDQSKEAPHST